MAKHGAYCHIHMAKTLGKHGACCHIHMAKYNIMIHVNINHKPYIMTQTRTKDQSYTSEEGKVSLVARGSPCSSVPTLTVLKEAPVIPTR